MSWEQFRAWIDYAQVDPFGSERGDMQAALIAHTADNVSRTLINVNRDPDKSNPVKPSKITDFLLRFGEDEKKAKEAGTRGAVEPARRHNRILSSAGWQRTVAQIKDVADIASATRKTRDRDTGEIKYE